MDKLRLLFSKTDRAVYISHLDLMRTLTRAFLRFCVPSVALNTPRALIRIRRYRLRFRFRSVRRAFAR